MARSYPAVVPVLLIALATAPALAQTPPASPSARGAQAGAPTAQTPAPSSAQGSAADDLSSQATDPTASLMSFNFINDFRTSFYDLDDSGYEFRFQGVIPFRVWGASNILRVVTPFQVNGPGEEGLKDVTLFDLLVFDQSWGRLAFGPVMSLAQSESDAPSKFAIGPAIGAMHPISKKLNVGLFNQNLFADHVGITQIQPIIAYQLGSGWALSAGDLQFIYDWEREEWVQLPLGFQIGKVQKVAGQPMRFALNPQWNFAEITGGNKAKVVFTVTLLAPAK